MKREKTRNSVPRDLNCFKDLFKKCSLLKATQSQFVFSILKEIISAKYVIKRIKNIKRISSSNAKDYRKKITQLSESVQAMKHSLMHKNREIKAIKGSSIVTKPIQSPQQSSFILDDKHELFVPSSSKANRKISSNDKMLVLNRSETQSNFTVKRSQPMISIEKQPGESHP